MSKRYNSVAEMLDDIGDADFADKFRMRNGKPPLSRWRRLLRWIRGWFR